MDEKKLTHFDAAGMARMVDITGKTDSYRLASASGDVVMSREAFDLVRAGGMKKGDVLGIARIAGIMAAKKVDSLIPLAHPLAITTAKIDFAFDDQRNAVQITSEVGVTGKTGVEMEALTAVSMAALTIYDMCKSVDKSMTIGNIRLLSKSGGKSGIFNRK